MNRTRCVLSFLGSLMLAATAMGQYELKSGNFNSMFVPQNASGAAATPSGPPNVANPPPTSSQFSAMGQVAGGGGPVSDSSVYATRYPSNPSQTFVLRQVTIGGVFASGVPRFSLGDVITPPLAQADGINSANASYWRVQPVQPGEIFQIGGVPTTPFPVSSVTVASASINATSVTVSGTLPSSLIVGATILGQPITSIEGNNVTLAGNSNATINSATSIPVMPASTYYYSPHAEKVFASQAGRVTITWVTRVADGSGNHFIRTEDFAVSSNTTLPVRKIYWTEGGFDGPKVQITDNRITTVNPAYYSGVPKAVAKEVQIPGNNPLTPNLTTISFDKFSGIGQLHAYNVEGRIFVEYLGNVRLAGNIHEFIGSDIVEIVRVPEVYYNTVHLGKEITPHEPSVVIAPPTGAGTAAEATATVVNGKVTALSLIHSGSGYGTTAPIVTFATPDNGTAATATAKVVNGMVTGLTLNSSGSGYPILTPAPVLSSLQNGSSYYGTTIRPDSSISYFAERATSAENSPDDGSPSSQDAYNKVVFYWLEEGAYSIQWPKFQDRYWLRWSPNLQDYAHYTVDSAGGNADTGVPFVDGALPSIIFQDDPAQSEASIDLATQRLFVNFSADSDQRNRSLLKFIGTSNVWYVNLYSQGENRSANIDSAVAVENGVTTVTVGSTAGLEVGMIVTGPGITGYGTITRIIDGTHYVMIPSGGPVAVGQIPNPSFETDAVPAYPGYLGAGGITGWTISGRAGLNTSAGPFADNGTVPHGSKVAFIQNDNGGNSMSTTITGLITGRRYEISFNVNARGGNSPGLNVRVNGTSLLNQDVASGGYQSKKVVFTATGTTATLKIENVTASGDHSLLLDNFAVRNFATLAYTVEGDADSPIKSAATVGDRLLPPAGHENAGYISAGTGYYPQGYLNPFVAGVEAASKGAIIPVNALPNDRQLTVRWFKKIDRPAAEFPDLYVPGKTGRYTVSYPATTSPQIVIAQGVGTNDLSGAQDAGSVYYQNDPSKPGYNPNEEHSFSLSPRAYALRDDLNITSGDQYTSEPFLLLAYQDPADNRPAMKAYKVVRSDATYKFDYTATAGTLLVKPYPLPLMPIPLVGTGTNRTTKDLEIVGADVPGNGSVSAAPAYQGFTFKDRKGFTWIHRGPHTPTGTPTLEMKLYYLSREGFFVPGTGVPEVGTPLPFLRKPGRSGQLLTLNAIDSNADGSPGGIDEPLTVIYRPAWPTDAPELRVAETLTLPKFGLPQIRGQASAEIFYQQSIANAPTATNQTKHSVVLHDSTREKVAALGSDGVTLAALPSLLKTTSYQGRTYFQGLPPHLQQRFYYEPTRGTKGSLILIGKFHDELAGEDYLDLNALTAKEVEVVKDLMPVGSTGKSDWDSAIDAMRTQMDVYMPDTARVGNYVVGNTIPYRTQEIPYTENPNIPVDSYALTASGKGSGYVTMVFGNGGNPDQQPQGDPVQVKVLKVAKQLYVGDLKVIQSSNPLDEQVTLRQSGDFAGRAADYEFEWRWTTGAATAPGVYSSVMTKRVGDSSNSSQKWVVVRDPGAVRPTAAQYTAAAPAVAFPRSENLRPVSYALDAQNRPTTTVIEASSYTDAEMAAGYPSLVAKSEVGVDFSSGVPGEIVFSANLNSYDGLVLYVNQRPVLAHNAPTTGLPLTNASSGLSQNGLSRQFSIASSYFTAGPNSVEVAVYTTADPNTATSLNFLLEASQETDVVVNGDVWQSPSDPTGINTNFAMVGSSPALPFGGPQFVLNDRWFTMRYRPKLSSANILTEGKATQNDVAWSRWMPPQFVEGWIKRVLAAINPFEQRVKDLYNNATNTDVSVLTQAGTRWEGDVALTMSNINDVGLIAIYETVLNRGKDMSINANTNDPDTNNALTLAAGYLNDLYTILGNEAYADAANPTISLDDQTSATEVNTSRFSFEGQVASSLDEELAMLRGRDDFLSPGVGTAPAYNRLYWNYTRGINSGEVMYAVNYNVKEKVGSSTADGVIDESDAQRMFPQGHGDAYGHYLTALTGYYRLLTNSNFTWTPRAEAVTVLGQPVTVDYKDERKFASAAANVARTAEQICSLVYRQDYKDDPSVGWSSYRDSKGANPQTGVTSRQGLDEWVSRSTQGTYLHWAVANSMVPDHDNYHSGVQKIDRTTVPELAQLVAAATSFQTTIDNASAGINPLGLTSGSIAFDLSPSEMKDGNSQFEQVYSRSLRALVNASGAFNQASRMTRSLRNQQNQVDDYNAVIVQQERTYVNQLIDLFGRPYSGDVGAGKTYAQGYVGPDTERWFVMNRPSDLVDTTTPVTVTMRVPTQVRGFTGQSIADVVNSYNSVDTKEASVTINPNRFAQFAEVMGITGTRPQTGALQDALLDAYLAQMALLKASNELQVKQANFTRQAAVFQEIIDNHRSQVDKTTITNIEVKALQTAGMIMTRAQAFLTIASETTYEISEAAAESLPKSVGTATDATSAVRGSIKLSTSTIRNSMAYAKYGLQVGAVATQTSADVLSGLLKSTLKDMDLSLEERQLAYEMEAAYRDLLSQHFEFAELIATQQRADQKAVNLRAEGDGILAEREVFRQRAAAVIQGYRTNDLGFRIFRNEALEQYRSLFDLASRYSYLAAKSYDYETGLLGTAKGQEIFGKIIASRSLGDLTGGVPQSTVSTLGDAGLAGTMAQLSADFSVAEGRLGINNPDQYGTVFSLRGELFRLLNDPSITSDDDAWQQTIERHIVTNLLSDSDVATYCRNLKKPNGTPVPGIVIPFSTTIQHGKNFFGLSLAGGDHAYTPTNFATKIYNVGIALPGYVGMDNYATGSMSSGAPASGTNSLSATPYAYLIPCGTDYMLAPPLGDNNIMRAWEVKDQALPLPYNLGANDFNSTQFFNANGTLSEQPWILRKHQAFRMVSDASAFYSSVPAEFTNSRLIGRSVWNSKWKLVIPAYTLSNNEQDGLSRFAASVKDIQLFLRTYSNSGN